jgi:hypothetical protein
MMKTALLARVVLSCSVLAVGGGIPLLGIRPDQGPVYSVARVQAGLAHRPAAWVGRTVQVRGVAACCFLWSDPRSGLPCLAAEEDPFDPCPWNVAVPLRTITSGRRTLVAVARGVPLLGPLIPAHAPLRWGVVTTYRVRLRAAPATDCGYRPCYEALLDAAP